MRSNPSDYEMVAPGSLHAIVSLLAKDPGMWLPIAGGTDVMVQYAAGKLPARKLVSIWNLPELRRIEVTADEVRIGAGCTYTDLRKHEVVGREFPLLSSAARWTGGIANQNRGTIGGNIVNASPAADSLPALLVYDAELILVSVRGERRLPYAGFHTAYKKTLLAPDELIQAVCLPRRFPGYFSHARKVGARNAQAISKVCIAALGRLANGVIEDVRIALGSVAPVPLRLTETEQAVRGKVIDSDLLLLARKAAMLRSGRLTIFDLPPRYRAAVAGNLVAEFLNRLSSRRPARKDDGSEETILARWNYLPIDDAMQNDSALLRIEGLGSRDGGETDRSRTKLRCWLRRTKHGAIWRDQTGWKRSTVIRESESRELTHSSTALRQPQSVEWSAQEQRNVGDAEAAVKDALADANREYERRFNRIFIVCATGKSAPEILEILRRRLKNDAETELHEAAEQQRQITQIRLRKWLQE